MRRELRDGIALHHLDLGPQPAGAFACVTGRHGGVSAPPYDTLNLSYAVGDDPAAVTENRRRLAAALGIGADELVLARQVHGATVVRIDGPPGAGARDGVADADALLTDHPDVVLAVLAADCVPVVVRDPVRGALAVAHAGWRGTVARVTGVAVDALVAAYGCRRGDLWAALGPSIGPASYEVGPEVVAAAQATFGDAPVVRLVAGGRSTFDLWAANVALLTAAGVDPARIGVAGVDTRCATDEFFSDRAARPCGRLVAAARLGAVA